jgi:hypothetical protein
MQTIFDFPYFEVQFNKEGRIHEKNGIQEAIDFIKTGRISDLLVITHGWNNDMAEAGLLYRELLDIMRQLLVGKGIGGLDHRTFAVLAVLWPSKKFAEKELIPSGAAGLGSAVTITFLQQELEKLKQVFDGAEQKGTLDQAKTLLPKIEDSPQARQKFADLLRSLVSRQTDDPQDAETQFYKLNGNEVMERLSKPVPLEIPKSTGIIAGASQLGSGRTRARGGPAGFLSGLRSAARNLLNLVTYYEMKERAATVGRNGVNQVLRTLREEHPTLKVHLIGHSFGGRLVTASADGPDHLPPVKADSMTLLQAAFSHHGFAERYDNANDGFFRKVVTEKKVSGPIVITFTQNDKAVGLAYPIASLIAGQQAAALGDKHSVYGGIGRNGAQKTPEGIELPLLPVGKSYEFERGKLYSLNGDLSILGHSDICKGEVAQAVLYAVATT